MVLEIYRLSDNFPQKEVFALSNQMRRAAVSVTSNIAEGFCRNSQKEKIQFYHISLGSTSELENQAMIAKDLGYISEDQYKKIADQLNEVGKLLNGLISSIR